MDGFVDVEKHGVEHDIADGSTGEKVRESVYRSEDESVNEWMNDVESKSATGSGINGGKVLMLIQKQR